MARRETHSRLRSLEPFTFDHFEAWSSGLILDNGSPWKLEPFQAEFVQDLFGGARECLLILPEGNGKTTLVAGLGLYGLRFATDALIPVAASSRDQARIMYRQAKGFLRRSKLDGDGYWFEAFDGYRRIDLRGPGATKRGEVLGSIEMHAADAGTGDGVIPYPYAFLDELHRHKTLELYETWRGKLDKRGAQIVTISTAGEPGGDFEVTREKVRQSVPVVRRVPGFTHCRSEDVAFHEYALEEGGDPGDMDAVKRCNPLPSITVASLAAKRRSPTMSAHHWARMVCNVATRSADAAIQEGEWHDAALPGGLPAGERVWLGLDVAWKWDTTAAVPLWMPSVDRRIFGVPRILTPPRDGTSLDPARVERALLELHQRNPVDTVVMDMHRAEQLAEWIRLELGCKVIDRPQSNAYAIDDYELFMEGLRLGAIKHPGDQELTRHALNAVARLMPGGGARFDRSSRSRQGGDQDARVIDGLTAMSMVHSVAYRQVSRKRPKPAVIVR